MLTFPPSWSQHAASLTLWNGRSIGSGVSAGRAVGNGVALGLGVGLETVGTPMTTVSVGAGVSVGGASVGVAFGAGVSVTVCFTSFVSCLQEINIETIANTITTVLIDFFIFIDFLISLFSEFQERNTPQLSLLSLVHTGGDS